MTKTIITMYGGTKTLIFEPLRHKYSIDNIWVPGVTSAIGILNKPQLISWAANMAADYFRANVVPGVALDEVEIDALWSDAKRAHRQRKEAAGQIGTAVHLWISNYIKGDNPPLPVNGDMRGACERFLAWKDENRVEFVLSEQLVYSDTFKYAGTADFVCRMKGRLWLGDIKTSSGIYDEYFYQCAAYVCARKEEFPDENFAGAVIVRVGKTDGEIETATKTAGELIPYLNVFLNCLETYKSLRKIEDKKYGK